MTRFGLCALSMLWLARCASYGQQRSEPLSSGPGAPDPTKVPRECAPFIAHFRPLFADARTGTVFKSKLGTFPLVRPSVDLARVERLDQAFGETAPEAPPSHADLGLKSSSLGRDFVENMRGLLQALSESDTTTYRKLSVRYAEIQAAMLALDQDVELACSEVLFVSGRIPAKVIQSIVRQNYDAFRRCYEGGLARNSVLEGRVTVRFVIGRDGSVGRVEEIISGESLGDRPEPGTERFFETLGLSAPSHDMDSTPIQDRAVVACILEEFQSLRFPPPRGGIVTVVYPLKLEMQ